LLQYFFVSQLLSQTLNIMIIKLTGEEASGARLLPSPPRTIIIFIKKILSILTD